MLLGLLINIFALFLVEDEALCRSRELESYINEWPREECDAYKADIKEWVLCLSDARLLQGVSHVLKTGRVWTSEWRGGQTGQKQRYFGDKFVFFENFMQKKVAKVARKEKKL